VAHPRAGPERHPGPGRPLRSIWPFAASLGLAILLIGLICGLWMVVLGAGVIGYATWGWLATVNRENRYGRIEAADTRPSSPPAAPAEAASFNPAEATPHPAEPTAEQDRAQPGDR